MRHTLIPVERVHFDLLGEQLIFALSEVLCESFTIEARGAWSKLYGVLSSRILQYLDEYNKDFGYKDGAINAKVDT
jgi:hemoglobin-like flavoprotein